MADIIKEWLNNQVELSKRVVNFEKDFANGFLFGELLFRFSQLPDMSNFKNMNTKEAKIENFSQILPVMRNLNLKFDSNITEKIIKEERGVALRILYQLKMALEKVSAPSLYKMKDEFVMSMPAQKIRPVREQYERMTDNFYKMRLQQKLMPEKEVLMRKKLARFRQERERQEQAAQQYKEEMKQQEREAKEQKRRAELNKLQRNAGFMDEWLEKGLNDWRVNMLKKKKREKEDENFKLKQAQKTLVTLKHAKETNKRETYDEIEQFDKRTQSFKKKATEMRSDDDSGDEMYMQQTVSPLATKPFIQRDSKYKQFQYNKEREQRRRKILMEQNKMHKEFEAKRREDDIIDRMNRLSRQEQELEYEVWRTGQCKTIIEENRKLREARYHKREDLDTEVIMIREEEALTALRNQLSNSEMIEKERADSYLVARNQFKHNDNSSSCKEFLDLIFDLADEVFKHQQLLDSTEFDNRNWREWTQLFVDKLPMVANSPMTYLNEVEEQNLEEANLRVDHLELLDYLASAYQWKRSSECQDKFLNNFNLGNIVRTLITWSYPEPPKVDRPKLALDVKLKLSIVGYAFAGKKTQAKMLCERHDIAFISIEELLKEALEECSPESEQEGVKKTVEQDPELVELGNEVKSAMLKGEEVTDEMYIKLIMYKLNKLFGFHTKADYYAKVREEKMQEIEDQKEESVEEDKQESLPEPEDKQATEESPEEPQEESKKVENEEVDQNVEEPIEDKKEETLEENPEENEEVLQESIEDEKEQEEIEDEKEQIEDEAQEDDQELPQELDNEEEMLIQEPELIVPLEIEEEPEGQKVKGFILVDFPSTLRQAKLLEEALTGYIGDEDKEAEVKDQLLAEASILATPTPLPPAPEELTPSGLDAVLWLKTTKTECIRRSFGLKKDLKNNFLYHVLYNPPPINENDVVEKLQPEIDSELLNAMLTDRHIAFDMARSALLKWLKRFGDQKRARCLLQEVDTPEFDKEIIKERGMKEAALNNIKTVNKKICEILDKVLEASNEEDDVHSNRVKAELEYNKKVQKLTLEFERQSMTYEDDVVRYITRQEEKKAREEEAERLAKEQKKGAAKTKKEAKKEVKKEATQEEIVPEEEEEKIPVPPVFPEIEPLDPKVDEAPPEIQIEDQFKSVLLEFWKVTSNIYTTAVKKNMRSIRKQREFIVKDVNTFQSDMLALLEKPQPRQKLIDEYIQVYNQFLDDNLDMIEDPETKMEMHQRVEDLCTKLLELVEDLQKTSLAKRESVMKSGWAEYNLETLLTYSQSLMQAEVNRYRSFNRFAEDFYAARDGRPMAEAEEEALFDPIVDGANLPPVEYEGDNCPRLDFLYQSAMGIVTGETPVVSKDTKGKKEAKKEVKKASKKEVAKKKDEDLAPAEENKELAELLETEKEILKYRLGMIKEWSEGRVKEIRETCKSLYDRLVDWIRVTIKCQREAINQLSMRLREAIEEERKIQKEIRMKSFDLIMDERFLYFIVPPPKLLPAIEAVLDTRFSIAQLQNMLLNLKLITDEKGMIDLGLLISLLSKKTRIGKLFGRDEGLPKSWHEYSYATYQQMKVNLDKAKTGYVKYKEVATYFVLLEATLPTEKELTEYDMKLSVILQEESLAKEDFAQVEAWFDGYEECEQREKAEKFDRVRMIKELLFDINKDNETVSSFNKC